MRCFTLAVLAPLIMATSVAAQDASDAELRRVVRAFRSSSPATTLASVNAIPAAPLSPRDRAIAEMFRGFALTRLRRGPEGELHLQRAAALDPAVIPQVETVGQDLVDTYRVARARIPIIGSWALSPTEFIPQQDSTTRLSYTIEGSRILRRDRAALRLAVVRAGSIDTAVIWRGAEGDSAMTWNGMVNGRLIEPGEYDYVLEARPSDIAIVTQLARRVRVEHLKIDSSRMLRRPAEPRILPESSVFMVEDRERKSALVKRAMIIGSVGALLAGVSAAAVQTAVDRSPPRSGLRYAVAGTYVAGLSTMALAAVIAWRSRSGRYRSEVAFPNNENIRLNRQLRAEYQAEIERVNRYNESLRRATVVKLNFAEGQSR